MSKADGCIVIARRVASVNIRWAHNTVTTNGDADEVPLQVTVPHRVKRALDVRAAQTGQTKRSIVLEGLRLVGLEVSDDEVLGRRGVRRH